MIMVLRKLNQEFYYDINAANDGIQFVFSMLNYSFCLTIDRFYKYANKLIYNYILIVIILFRH